MDTHALKFSFIALLASICLAGSCQKKEETNSTLKQLYQSYKDGSINQCEHEGELVYVGALNAYDVPAHIYNRQGEIIGNCNYAWGQVDSICEELQNCEVIYRCDNHISGQPPVDKYHLAP